MNSVFHPTSLSAAGCLMAPDHSGSEHTRNSPAVKEQRVSALEMPTAKTFWD
jgi:hypothetical protein